jgi:hypothetical protein
MMQFQMRPQTDYYQINWRGVLGLVAMAIGGVLGWVAIFTGFLALVR